MSQAAADALQRRLRRAVPAEALAKAGIWLLIIQEARMAPTALVENLVRQDRELACILGASIRTAQGKARRFRK